MDATVGDREPFITLVETKAKSGEKLPSNPAQPGGSVATLLREFYNRIQRGEMNGAEETLNQVRPRLLRCAGNRTTPRMRCGAC